MLKLKLQYFGHLMQRTDSLEKILMLGKTEGRRRRGWQRTRCLDGITDSMASLVAQMIKHLPTMPETWVQSLGQEDLLEKEMATHSSILAWKILRSLVGYSPWGCKKSETTAWLHFHFHWLNGHEFEHVPEDGEGQEAWCAAVHGVSKSQRQLNDWRTITTSIFIFWQQSPGNFLIYVLISNFVTACCLRIEDRLVI